PYLREACGVYVKRLGPLIRVTITEIRPAAASDGVSIEATRILDRVDDESVLWALGASGRELSSVALAAKIDAAQRSGKRRLALAIGGDRGLGEAVRVRADFVWSLSQLTFLHEMARLIVLEQLYRALKINRAEPYHRG
ncbi:MAG: 23S rRNA (pseudouridine(1915)-N(3))-methyltransferase RlmH, partial [Candidatus Eremiobacteraeota bacterium]|nr:23S rRNA (pseudouridine(1915)-N(3))-methyltransferase RlmH [Candidatus Eremiobacteraeota bacterium]